VLCYALGLWAVDFEWQRRHEWANSADGNFVHERISTRELSRKDE
jgi:hypothetical protein